MSAEDALNSLQNKRRSLKGVLTRLKNAYAKIESSNESLIQKSKKTYARLSTLEPMLDNFCSIMDEIELLDGGTDEYEDDRESFETTFYDLKSEMEIFLDECNVNSTNNSVNNLPNANSPSNSNNSNAVNNTENQSNSNLSINSNSNNLVNNQFNANLASNQSNENFSNNSTNNQFSANSLNNPCNNQFVNFPNNTKVPVKLPELHLVTFSGLYEEWAPFSETFNSLINSNQFLDKIQKFHYLRSCLIGEAANTIKSLELIAANYDIAWDILEKRFNNRKITVNKHLRALFDIPNSGKQNLNNLRLMYDAITNNLQSLSNLNEPVEYWDSVIIFLIEDKFDFHTNLDWERYSNNINSPKLDDLKIFIKQKCNMLEKLELQQKSHATKQNLHHSNSAKPVNNKSYEKSKAYISTFKQLCNFCQKDHHIYFCEDFLKLTPNDRLTRVRSLNLCTNCLKQNHTNKECKNPGTCKTCHKKHNSLLHLNLNFNNSTNDQLNSLNRPETSGAQSTSAHTVALPAHETLLPTAEISVKNKAGKFIKCRALLDSGAQSCFVTNSLFTKLGVPFSKNKITISGISNNSLESSKQANITIKSNSCNFTTEIMCIILETITSNLPSYNVNLETLNIPRNIVLADKSFHISNNIDMLIGANLFWDLLCIGQIKLGKNLPILQKTKLGWIISGNLPFKQSHNLSNCNLVTSISIDDQIKRFWELEEIINPNSYISQKDQFCENHYNANTSRLSNGRFVVKIPIINQHCNLAESRNIALKRFYSMENKLNKDIELKKMYSAFMKEYQDLDHMTEIKETFPLSKLTYYLPHHPVIKLSNSTTKLRVVFDGSAKVNNLISLNSIQEAGPTIQHDIFSILLRFRRHPIALTADIEKMYRQVLISPDQRDLQRIFWRPDSNSDLKCFQLNTVTYGTASAPFLAIRTLLELSKINEINFPLACSIIANDFYVDDMITGGSTIDEVIKIKEDVTNILSSAGFRLHKWISNHPSLINNLESNAEIQLGETNSNKSLGVLWNSTYDYLHFKHLDSDSNKKYTKRNILSTLAKIYDPLGLISPINIQAKLIMQQIWMQKIHWDESLPSDIHSLWDKYLNDIKPISEIKINRFILAPSRKRIEIHGFCDASEAAYGACIYVKTIDISGKPYVNLLCSKSRVAPLKHVSLPRLELCGALLLANLISRVIKIMHINFNSIYLWSDSTITLHWIKGDSSRWQTFVANRVGEIQQLTNTDCWYHVRTSENPADIITRGVSALNLKQSTIWWNGPSWLQLENNEWPITELNTKKIDSEMLELRNNKICNLQTTDKFILFEKFSKLNKLLRVTAYCLKFIHNCKHKNQKRNNTAELSVNEIENATSILFKTAQKSMFQNELKDIQTHGFVNNNSRILSLSPIIGQNGILRVGGRLNNANVPYDQQHPILLQSNHPITKLIIRNEHEKLLHCGPQMLLSSLRNKYWILSGRDACRRCVHSCIACFKAKPKPIIPFMGNLPTSRVNPAPPFYHCGVDYAGPLLIKDRKSRKPITVKAYICLFVCFTTKAIHLELVTDLSSESFIAALRRFTSRRGTPKHMYSDNGTTFIGADSELKNLYNFLNSKKHNELLNNFTSKQLIEWHFIPPRAPHFGGLWEAGVKSVKNHLKRIIQNALLTYEELNTILIQIEGVLNSRPLSPLSTDPNDLQPLTPAHFLIGRPITSTPDPDCTHIQPNRLNRFQFLQQINQHFWKRWSTEYLSTLQPKAKWMKNQPQIISIGTMVIIREDNLPPSKWNIGRIIDVHPGKDNIIRVVSVKTSTGVYKRALTKLSILPVDTTNN